MNFASLVAGLDCRTQVRGTARGATHEVEQDVVWVSFGQIEGGRGTVQTTGVGVGIVDYLFVGGVLGIGG